MPKVEAGSFRVNRFGLAVSIHTNGFAFGGDEISGGSMDIVGTWILEGWRRYRQDGSIQHPFGERPRGLLIYTPDGYMAVQMVSAQRCRLDTDDALGGSEAERAQAYSTCLAYFGRYRLEKETVVHELEGSLFPNWSNTSQVRPFVIDGHRLILQVKDETGRLTNDIGWSRSRHQN